MQIKEQIYSNLKKVPKGKVITYKELAKSVNPESHAYRFVGTCMRTNKDPIKIPCYKVVKSDGKVGNYSSSGGTKLKIKKLQDDGIEIINNKIDLEKYGYSFY